MSRRSIRAALRASGSIAILVTLCALLAGSCYSTNYRQEIAANTSLLSDLADKLNDYCRVDFVLGDRPVSSEEMGEFYYALQKARAWSQMTARSHGARASYRDFLELLANYQTFVRDADAYRLARKPDPSSVATLARKHDAVTRAAEAVMTALRDER